MSDRLKRICWITPDYFLMVDAPVVPRLAEYYDVDWVIIRTRDSPAAEVAVSDGKCVPQTYNLIYRQRDPRVIGRYLTLATAIRRTRYDLVYTSFHGLPYCLPILAALLDLDKVIYAVHNVRTPLGAVNEWAMRVYHRCIFGRFRRFHVFSEYQLRTITRLLPKKTHYYAPFAPVDYGVGAPTPRTGPIRFLFFGRIKRYKRLDILISAFRNLRDAGVTDIELCIAGQCDNWGEYEPLVGDEANISTRIGFIRNDDVADLVSSCHYFILPYQDIAQSAVLTLAYHYGKPVIVSDIEGFRQHVVNGLTGFFFQSESVESLTAVMRDTIASHAAQYACLTQNVAEYMSQRYSTDTIVARYRHFIDDAIGGQRESGATTRVQTVTGQPRAVGATKRASALGTSRERA